MGLGLGLDRPRGLWPRPRPRPRGLWPRPRPRGLWPRPRPRGVVASLTSLPTAVWHIAVNRIEASRDHCWSMLLVVPSLTASSMVIFPEVRLYRRCGTWRNLGRVTDRMDEKITCWVWKSEWQSWMGYFIEFNHPSCSISYLCNSVAYYAECRHCRMLFVNTSPVYNSNYPFQMLVKNSFSGKTSLGNISLLYERSICSHYRFLRNTIPRDKCFNAFEVVKNRYRMDNRQTAHVQESQWRVFWLCGLIVQ